MHQKFQIIPPYLHKLFVAFLFFQLLCHGAFSQGGASFVNNTLEKLSKRSSILPLEKVYLQFDKPYYAAGDIIWFRAYLTIGASHRLSAKSRILNVELVNNKTQVKQNLRLALENGMASGHFNLPDTLEAATYRIRAYTNWMRNEGNAYYFEQRFIIGNAIYNNLSITPTYAYPDAGRADPIAATIHFATGADSAYANREVRYNILKNGRSVMVGKGITDRLGNLSINLRSVDSSLGAEVIETTLIAGKRGIKRSITVQRNSNALSVKFFPEGGNLVEGLPSVVAFKAIGGNGLGKSISGVITDNLNQEVAVFKSSHLGMGSFSFTPQAGKTYRAHISNNGAETIMNIPAVQPNGFVMRLFNDDSTQVIISIVGNSKADSASTLHLIAQSNSQLCFAASIKINGPKPVLVKIPKDRFPSGVAQFTLFAASGEPLNERIAFIYHNADVLNMQVNTDKKTYHAREKVDLNLKVTDNYNHPATGSFSAAVINETALKAAEPETSILSTILLTSDLKGYVENPEYYFTNVNDQTEADLDLLMLTQGYRKINWTKLQGNEQPVFEAQRSFSFTGSIKTPSGKPVANGKVRLLTRSGAPVLLDTISDANGRFGFHNLTFKDSTRFALQANSQKGGSDIIIELDSASLMGDRSFSYQTINPADTIPGSYLLNSKNRYQQDVALSIGNHSYQLKEVIIKETKVAQETHTSNLNGPGHASVTISGDEIRDRGCPTLASCLAGRLKGVIIGVDGGARAPKSNNSIMYGDGSLAIKIDGVFVTDGLNVINPSDVASVELIMDPVDLGIYGVQGVNGIIQINTRNGRELGTPVLSASNIFNFNPTGYQVTSDFYSPDYAVSNDVRKADLRTTISWQPKLLTDANGDIKFSFYNADALGTYRVIIEGIDNNGNLGRQIYRYKVE